MLCNNEFKLRCALVIEGNPRHTVDSRGICLKPKNNSLPKMCPISFILLILVCADVKFLLGENVFLDVSKLMRMLKNTPTPKGENETILVLCGAGLEKSMLIECLTSNCRTECNFQGDIEQNEAMDALPEVTRYDNGNVWYIFPVLESENLRISDADNAINEVYITFQLKRVIESSTKIKLVWAEQFEDVYYRTISLDKLFSRSVHLIRNITQYENSVSLVGNYRFYWAFPFHTRIDNLETHLEITKTDDSEMKISLREMRYSLGDDAKNESKRCQLLDALLGGGDYTSDFPRISTFVPIRKFNTSNQIEPNMKEMLAMESCQMESCQCQKNSMTFKVNLSKKERITFDPFVVLKMQL